VPDEKDCLCRGLGLYIEMMNAYEIWMNSMVRGEEPMGNAAFNLVYHLEQEFATPKYADHQEPAKSLLEHMRYANKRAIKGQTSNMMAMEVIRDAIHRNPVLQQMLTCGPVYTKENETPTTRIIAKAADDLDDSPEKAREPLSKHYEEISCTKGDTN